MEKKIYLFFYIIILLFGCKTNSNDLKTGFENYRYNPFQFPYPEYYLKAETVLLSSMENSSNTKNIRINYYGLYSYIDNTAFDSVVYRRGTAQYYLKNKKKVFIILFNRDSLIGCSDSESRNINLDFCSAISSNKEYFSKLFTLIPDDLDKKEYLPLGNSWIVHHKGSFFQDIKTITIYKNKDYLAFRRDFRGDKSSILASEVVVFHNSKNPNYNITFAFTTPNELLLKQLLTTMTFDNSK